MSTEPPSSGDEQNNKIASYNRRSGCACSRSRHRRRSTIDRHGRAQVLSQVELDLDLIAARWNEANDSE